ncbi:helix-turn-helix transcriptional regulator [Kibdelosporangium persicum]|uniref:XRE family transcriptional regulator n=1 Tax=Kibdelosporangium persicum TaxID=2698649 RepID=A0ABX2FIN1_9PSEU|nr:helix-turn-helix transcriptional regulator [Kibdelosporangium persicum]NRN71271.1 XRE family transcriptional regulator [Kibdelosporangium persicum]
MTEPTRPTFLRRKLGAKLRRMREEAGHTLESAAPMLDKTKSALHRIETGETRADVHLVRSIMDLYQCYDEELLEEVREALKTPWYRVFGIRNSDFFDVETEASEISQFLLIEVPGLLQTRAYMRTLFSARCRQVPVDTSMKVRLYRQRRLTSEDHPLQLHSIVCEAALRRRFGPPELMQEQLRHLITMSELPTVTLQVLQDRGTFYLPNAPFTVLSFPDPDDPRYLYMENPTGSLQTEDHAQVEEARLLLEALRIEALNPSDSVAFIEELARNR